MSRLKLDTAYAPPPDVEIYAIFRVYNLGTNAMDMRIYLDPKTFEIDKKLSIFADTYTVVPTTT